ncbi:aldehyde dehydrogenase family protein [bacterium]|nr:aldehyde dehydrogenase family protein [bacterium]
MEAQVKTIGIELAAFFKTGTTLPVSFRIKQLNHLKKALAKNQDKLLQALKQDLGKHETEGYASEIGLVFEEINHAIKNLRAWASPQAVGSNPALFPTRNTIYPQPKGLSLIIAPWNYPVQLVFAPLVASIAAGCCAIVKPSELAPACEKIIAQLIQETFDSKYINAVCGNGAEVVPPIIESGLINHVFFTGSTAVGRSIAVQCAENFTSYTLELGGKSPAIVHPSANIKVSAKRIAWGKFYNCGQTCVAPDYVLVHEDKAKELCDELKESIKTFFGNNAAESNSYGRIINDKQFNKLISYLEQGEIIYGGKHNAEEKYIEPTLILEPPHTAPIMREEIFGPILPILTYRSIDEIFEIIAKNSNPLALYVFTSDSNFERKIIRNIAFGGGCVNNTIIHLVSSEMPFGGIGTSGMGSYHGKAGFDAFTHYKSISKTGNWLDLKIKYPPYNAFKNAMVKLFLR